MESGSNNNKKKYISDNQIVPDEVQNRLIILRSVNTSVAFEIGDIANDLCDKSGNLGLPVTAKRIYAAVSNFCGKSARTVRYYAEVSAFFSRQIRDEYDHLSFSHFVFAKSMDGRWNEVLEYASKKPQISVEELRFAFANQGDQKDFDEYTAGERLEETGEVSPLLASGNGRGKALSIVSRLAEAVDDAQLALDEGVLCLTEPDRASLESAFMVIKEKVVMLARSSTVPVVV